LADRIKVDLTRRPRWHGIITLLRFRDACNSTGLGKIAVRVKHRETLAGSDWVEEQRRFADAGQADAVQVAAQTN
jgi:hypothetical protein